MPPASSDSGRSRILLVVAGLAIAVVVGVLAFSFGRLSTLAEPTPLTNSAEAGFARDMQVHHNQGVELAMIIRELTDDEEVRRLAYDIALTQGHQSGQMYAWLVSWDLPQYSADPPMAWMGDEHGHGGAATDETDGYGGMPGLVTPEQIEELSTLEGVEAERMFLELMIEHHLGAVVMAEALLERSDHRMVAPLARGVVESQESEIDLMERMLAERS